MVYGFLVTVNRNDWGRLYLIIRGEILGFVKDKLMRRHSAKDVFINQERKFGDQIRSDT
jgi:hypothetical protein